MWHVSIARLGRNSMLVSTDRWGDGVMRAARRVADESLTGVGTGESVELLRSACLHLRRSLSDDEIAILTPEWLAIPARDEFSEDGKLEARL